jgi:hypothetical protein
MILSFGGISTIAITQVGFLYMFSVKENLQQYRFCPDSETAFPHRGFYLDARTVRLSVKGLRKKTTWTCLIWLDNGIMYFKI